MENINKKEKKIHLTFDDGPTPGITTRVLSLLNEYNAKATFFCLGKNVVDNPELYQKIKEQGHSIGNHSYSHLNGWKTPRKQYFEDIKKAEQIINSKLYRPPYGKISIMQWIKLRKKFRLILWTCLSRDYDPKKAAGSILKKIKKASHAGAVIVFHDSEKAWPVLQKVLPLYLEFLKSKNFSCQPIE
jgi:peptidoglycan-N-acetylglucosamine deacetylase